VNGLSGVDNFLRSFCRHALVSLPESFRDFGAFGSSQKYNAENQRGTKNYLFSIESHFMIKKFLKKFCF
jgi:hypothetical protein